METRLGSGLRRMLCLVALLVGFVAEVWSMDEAFRFDLYVGGVKVTSSNAANIKGENIEAYSESVNEGKPLVYYESAANTLYLYNVRICRSGKNHHAIESNVPSLHIKFRGDNELQATDASAVRLNANTDITTTWFDGRRGTTFITGVSEDALYAGKDQDGRSPVITIDAAHLILQSKSSAFDAAGDPSLTISRSIVTAECQKNKDGDCYALFDYKSLTIKESIVQLKGYSQAIKNLKSLTLGPGMYMEEPSRGSFSSSAATVINSSGNVAQNVAFKMSTVEINSATFPDENFRNWVLGQSYGADGYLTPYEIADVTYMSISNENIANLKGIEHFTALRNLACWGNKLTKLDLSKNTALTILYCYNNSLTTLNLSNNTSLTNLYCSNNGITTLDLSNNTVLAYLDCNDNNLSTLILPRNFALTTLYCNNNKLSSLNVSNNTTLTDLQCSHNSLGTLDVSKNTALTKLYCDNNKLTSLNVSNNTSLTDLQCGHNGLSTFNVSNNTSLKKLYCDHNKLTSLNVSKNTALTDLDCSSNNLGTLDVSKNMVLTNLKCGYNNLTTLDVSKNVVLKDLCCQCNKLTSLDMSYNVVLKYITCYLNGIRGKAMTTLVNSLRVIPAGEDVGVLYIESNEITAEQVNIAKGKHWKAMIETLGNWEDYEGLPKGDVNADGSVDNKDVEDLTNFILGKLPKADKWFFDVDGNGVVDVADIVHLINIINE